MTHTTTKRLLDKDINFVILNVLFQGGKSGILESLNSMEFNGIQWNLAESEGILISGILHFSQNRTKVFCILGNIAAKKEHLCSVFWEQFPKQNKSVLFWERVVGNPLES